MINSEMRDANEEERKSTKNYIDSISKPTGMQFDEAYEELDFVQPHKKISVNLQLCEDAVSRQALIDKATSWDAHFTDSERVVSLTDIVSLPSVQPQPKMGEWIAMSEGFSPYQCSECETVEFKKSSYCPNCGCRMNGGGEE